MIINELKSLVSKKPSLRVLRVKRAFYLTPSVVRVTFAGPELHGISPGREGGNCKLTLPKEGQAYEEFIEQLDEGITFPTRTYTVRAFRENALEMDIDFVAHGAQGPASRWAMSAKSGDFCGFRGPSPAKVDSFQADWYLLAADLSALPVTAATLEAMPPNAQGVAIFEVTSDADKQVINAPKGIELHWLIHSDPHAPSLAQEALVRQLDWPKGRVKVCVAGESGIVKLLRQFLINQKGIDRADAYISGYWKIGLKEDEHQTLKKTVQTSSQVRRL
jgi:NADPH-dependent ferric siderophore reductase